MSSEPDNLVLVYLRRLDAKVDRVIETQGEVVYRLGRLEEGMARFRRDQSGDAETVAHVQAQVDRLREQVERINRRLDIVD